MLKKYLSSSIGKKQVVAVSGLAMVLFLLAHLAGNLLIFKGAEAYNAYSAGLKELGAILWVARIGLIFMFFTHFIFIFLLVKQNREARGVQYSEALHKNTRSLSTKLMPVSGGVLLLYIITHLIDFTFTHSTVANATLGGEFLGLYGLVVNHFLNPFSAIWYIVAMFAVGFHLTHAVQSVAQTFGLNHAQYTPFIKKLSVTLGIVIAAAFASVPIYVLFLTCSSGSCTLS
jgi:succinate dehydrogenase / fumarate reductase, cytochrome b subunit